MSLLCNLALCIVGVIMIWSDDGFLSIKGWLCIILGGLSIKIDALKERQLWK